MLKVEGFTKTYGSKILRYPSIYARKRIVLLTGANGSGKTTFLSCLSGCLQSDSGFLDFKCMLAVNGTDLPKSLKVGDYLSMLSGFEKTQSRLQDLKAHFGIETFLQKRIGTLSKGMAQRVALVASLMHGDGTILLDEPMQGLDSMYKQKLVLWMDKSQRPFFVATHEPGTYQPLECEVHHLESSLEL